MILDIFDHPNSQYTNKFLFKKNQFTWSKKARCRDETTACWITRFVNGKNTLGHTQPFVVIWSDISWSLLNQKHSKDT